MKFYVGQKVRVYQPGSSFHGWTGVVSSLHAGSVHVDALPDEPSDYRRLNGPFAFGPNALIAVEDTQPLPTAKPAKKPEQDLQEFFKGPTNYKSCPNCSTGKLVPMFSGEALCDQACERNPAAQKSLLRRYWATVDRHYDNTIALCTLWDSEESAKLSAVRSGCGMTQVEVDETANLLWLPGAKYGFQGTYANVKDLSQVRELAVVATPQLNSIMRGGQAVTPQQLNRLFGKP